MASRQRLLLAAAGVVAFLFAGRWAATLFADAWWGAQFAPPVAAFLVQLHLLRLALDLGGMLVASAWFAGHLLVVTRAIESVQVARDLTEGATRETIPAPVLARGALVAGVLLGVLAGADASRWWADIALAAQGASFGLADPWLGRDAGVYVAQLPVWRLAHGYATLLVLLAAVAVTGLYVVIGGIRLVAGRVEVALHARGHLGWLLASLAAVIAWGALLHPFEWVGGVTRAEGAGGFEVIVVASPIMAGAAAVAALCSVLWGYSGRGAVLLWAWGIATATWLGGRVAAPIAGNRAVVIDSAVARRLGEASIALERLAEAPPLTALPQAPPATPALWTPAAIARVGVGDSAVPLAVDAAVLRVGAERRAAWLAMHVARDGRPRLTAVADDRTTTGGLPLILPAGGGPEAATLAVGAVRPGAPEVDVGPAGLGPPIGPWWHRIPLAWALQAPELLGGHPAADRVGWLLSPSRRLAHMAPFAEWGSPVARLVDGRIYWFATGYVSAEAFPLGVQVQWNSQPTGYVRDAFLGVIDAATGATHLYLRPEGGPVAAAWAALARGLIEPPAALNPRLAAAAPYPGELFAMQARALANTPRTGGHLAGRADSLSGDAGAIGLTWARGGDSPSALAAYEREGDRRIAALLQGQLRDGRPVLTLTRVDSALSVPGPAGLEYRWGRFVTFDQLRDSVKAADGRLEAGPVRYWLNDGAVGAYQVQVGWRADAASPAIVWVSIAAGDRLGAGRTLEEAWSNLKGTTLPTTPATAAMMPGALRQLDEARRWFRAADSAARRGDWSAFGDAFGRLRTTLERPAR